jgi:cAMP-binding proteins - catabolite gene activator and regulatory subunit of cAMP-dependent protein kinases
MDILTSLKLCPLFKDMQEDEIKDALQYLKADEKHYQKNQMIASQGEIFNSIGIVLSGSLHIIKDDVWGNRSIITSIDAGQLFAEVYACSTNEPLEVSIITNQNTTVLFLHITNILKALHLQKYTYTQLCTNLISVLATKNLLLTRKMEHITKRTTREKLLSYLSEIAVQKSCYCFTIPFNRQQLADFLSVDRSAMSKEISKMQKDGLIKVKRNTFQLITSFKQ